MQQQQPMMMMASSSSSSSSKLYTNNCQLAIQDALPTVGPTTILVGGFGDCGAPNCLLAALAELGQASSCITLVSATGGSGQDSAMGRVLASGCVQRLVTTYIGADPTVYRRHLAGELELELVTQGVLAERVRAGGSGVAAFYTRAGVGTLAQTGGQPIKYCPVTGAVLVSTQPKETRQFNNEEHIMEEALRGQLGLVRAWKADTNGNLLMRRSANNFNSIIPLAVDFTIAEVDEIVPAGQLDPDCVHVPGVCVHRIVLRRDNAFGRTIARRQLSVTKRKWTDQRVRLIVQRAAKELPANTGNSLVNLGLGIPTLIANLPVGINAAQLHSENGIIGVGGAPADDASADPDIINASRDCVTLQPGAVCLNSAQSFALVNGGRLTATILGASQVSEQGDIANWLMPGHAAVGMGGAMDLVARPNSTRVIVAMRHCDSAGRPKIVRQCSLPLTGRRCVSRIVTELAVFDVDFKLGLTLVELADGVCVEQLVACTDCPFVVSPKLRRFSLNDSLS